MEFWKINVPVGDVSLGKFYLLFWIFLLSTFRTHENYSALTFGVDNYDFWGKCTSECKGEKAIPESKYNLAKDDTVINSVWSHALYDLLKYEAGSCFTYDPPQMSGTGVSNGLYFQLGHEKLYKKYDDGSKYHKRDSSYMLYSFDVYLHEKVNCH